MNMKYIRSKFLLSKQCSRDLPRASWYLNFFLFAVTFATNLQSARRGQKSLRHNAPHSASLQAAAFRKPKLSFHVRYPLRLLRNFSSFFFFYPSFTKLPLRASHRVDFIFLPLFQVASDGDILFPNQSRGREGE